MAHPYLATAAIVTGGITPIVISKVPKTFQAWGVTSAGAGAATIAIQGSMNSDGPWDTVGTLTLTLATTIAAGVSDSFTSLDRYSYHRANVTAISGTDAAVTAMVAT